MIRIALCTFFSLLICLPAAAASSKKVRLTTDYGDIIVVLYPERAPKNVANFLAYVNSGFYDGSIFHRVLPNFMIQTGGYSWDFQKKATQPEVVNESIGGLKNHYATLAMARTNDPDSADSQFFINVKSNPHLDAIDNNPGYTVFAKVIEGMNIVVMISRLPQGAHGSGFSNAPNEAVRILKAEVIKPRILIQY
jgi:peptidyl-prolyl cis-trans isomerase A (cyclophilin A)|tara:strand:+ start:1925 stop:2506 length:582 start_codon:yes stop_codon:yes gene_type:complete